MGKIIRDDVKPTEEEIRGYIRQQFIKHGETGVAWALFVVNCESGYNPTSYNESSGVWGMWQFKAGTFYANAKRLGIKNPNYNSWIHQTEIASYMYGKGMAPHWPECNQKFNSL